MDIQLRNFLVWIYLTISICLIQSTWSDNISRGKPATQLGTWSGNTAERAVDGNPDQNLDEGSCAHPHGYDGNLDQSLRGSFTWWSVDLSDDDDTKRFVIKNVTIYFRACCESRIRGVEIRVGNTSNVADHQLCASVTSSDHTQTLPCSPSTAVRYLTIRHPTQDSLGLCEVIVNGYQYQSCPSRRWGQDCLLDCTCGNNDCNAITGQCGVITTCPDGFFGKNCDNTCNCRDQTEICDRGDGYCPGGCKAGYMNTNCSTPCTGFKFGEGCAADCRCLDLREKCNPVDGSCRGGCEDGYWSSNCSLVIHAIDERPLNRGKTATSVTMEFRASSPRADEYLVEYAVDRDPVQYLSGVIVPDTNRDWYTVTQGQLTPATNYKLRVVPFKSGRRGGESDPLLITTSPPPRPSIREVPRGTSTSTSIMVEFQASDPVAQTYRVEYRARGAAAFMTGPVVSHVQGQTQVATLNGLQPDTDYEIKIIPMNPGVEGESSLPLYIRTKSQQLPSIRYAPQERATTSTSITVEFQASDPVADTYQVEYRARGAFMTGPTVSHVQGQTQVATIDGLQPNTEYTIKITPILKGVQGTSSTDIVIKTKTLELPAIKDAPEEGSSTTSSITVQFKASDPIAEEYRVEYKAQGAAAFTTGAVVSHVQGQTTQVATIEDLQPGTTYAIRIIPIIQGMDGPFSPVGYIETEISREMPPTLATTTGITTTDDDGDVEKTTEEDSSNGGMIAGIIVVIIILIIIIIAFLLYRRKKSGKPIPGSSRFGSMFARLKPSKLGSEVDPGDKPAPPEISGPVHNPEDPPDVRVIGHEYETPPSTPMPSVPPTPDPERKEVTALPPIRLEDLSNYIKNKKNQTDAFKEEFKKLPIGPTSKWEVGNKPENRNKNRFLNIRAYDHSRVVLNVLPEDLHSDYINADYISGYGGIEKVYVAAQGPKKGTVEDTWRLVWQTESNRIVMVTNLVEGGRIKCEQYWPNKGTEEYGDMKVTLVSTDNYAAYLIRIFNVERAGDSRTIRQFHFTSWPDHGVPTVATELLEFRRRVKSFDKEATGPVVIHCSAGVGRTGTYIAVDYCLQQAEHEHEVNVWGITNQMRKQRVNMIQTLDQYIFVHDAIEEALLSGETIITASNFRTEYGRLCRKDPETNKIFLSKQFEILESLKTPPGDTKPLVALETDNIKKNRFKEIVPSNRYRPFLSSIVEGTTSYINAVYVDGFREKLAYLVTQMPLPNTVVDLWRLMHDHHSSTIVMLNSQDKNDKDVGVYWPEDTEHTLNYGPLEVMMTSVDTEHPHITIRDFKIISTKTRRTPVVRQFQLNTWPKEDTYPESRRSLLELIDMIEKWQQQTGNGPVTVHDMNGATRCGLFVATLYATEQLKVDQAVDVFGAVKQVRIPRPHFIEDIEQYKFIHEMVLEYMSGFGDYSNFS